MNRLKSPIRRALAAAAGAMIGIAGAVAFAAPASAHHPNISGTYCLVDSKTKEYRFDWRVGNSEEIPATILKVSPREVGNIKAKATLPPNGDDLTGTETRTPSRGHLDTKLTVKAQWKRPHKTVTEERTIEATKLENCAANPSPSPTVTESPDPETTQSPDPEVTESPDPEVTESPDPETSNTPDPGPTAEPVEPVGTLEFTCDEMIFTIENPTDESVTVTFTPNTGEPKTLTVEPGQTGSVTFAAKKGLTVTPTGEGLDDSEPIAWEQPEGCGGGGGGLPVTGAAAAGIAGGAVVLLAIGVTLFLVARRRRLTFTA